MSKHHFRVSRSNGLRIATLELRPAPGTVIHVLCRRSAPLVAIAPVKRTVNTRPHVRAPFQGFKIKRSTNSKVLNVLYRRSVPLVAIAPIKKGPLIQGPVSEHHFRAPRSNGAQVLPIDIFKTINFRVLSLDANQDLLQLWLQSIVFNLVVKPNEHFTQKRIHKSEFEMFH